MNTKQSPMFSHNMKVIRSSLKMTQEEIALKLGVTRDVLSNYEQGRTDPSIEVLVKLAQITGITIDQILYQKLREENIPGAMEPSQNYTQAGNLYDIRDLVDAVKQLQEDVAELKKKG